MRSITALALLVAIAHQSNADPAVFWVSTSGDYTGVGAPSVFISKDSILKLHIWGRPATNSDGELKSLHNISLNLVLDQPHVDILDTFRIDNDGDLFEWIVDSTSDDPLKSTSTFQQVQSGQADAIIGLTAAIFDTTQYDGIGSEPVEFCSDDVCETGWRLATFEIQGVSSGTTNLRMQIGSLGITHAREGLADTEVRFGGLTEYAYNASSERNGDRQNPIPPGTFDLPDLTITTFGVVTPLPDFDQDGDVDSADSTIQFINWTGALPPGVGTSTFQQGDADGDGDVDTADQNDLLLNWTGALQLAQVGFGVDEINSAWLDNVHTSFGVELELRDQLGIGETMTVFVPEPPSLPLTLSAILILVAQRYRKTVTRLRRSNKTPSRGSSRSCSNRGSVMRHGCHRVFAADT